MTSEAMPTSEYQTLLVQLLQTTSDSRGDRQVLYAFVQANQDQLNLEFAQHLRSWAQRQFHRSSNDRAKAIAKLLGEFSDFMQQFPGDDEISTLQIAIAGYEMALQVLTKEEFPQSWHRLQSALMSANKQLKKRQDQERREQQLLQNVEQLSQQVRHLQQTLDTDAAASGHAHQPAKNYNAAIFYDIENLTRGYKFSEKLIADLSLREIVSMVKDTGKVGRIAIQRAYANWSDSRLRGMRREIVELGIDPIQLFGFGHGPHKNAADIQLAIDVMEVVHTRPSVEVFIIVSGDGAFASLAKKLHEYGKIVIGCAYEAQTNRVLESVGDAFVRLRDPEDKLANDGHEWENNHHHKADVPEIDLIATTKQVLPQLKQDIRMIRGGIVLPQVRNFLVENIENFEDIYAQYAESVNDKRFTSFLKLICNDTEFDVDKNHPAKLILRSGANGVPENVHCEERYRQILLSGYKKFKLEDPQEIAMVADALANHPIEGEAIEEAAEKIEANLDYQIPREKVLNCLLAFLSAECLEIVDRAGPPWKWMGTLKPEFQSAAQILQALRNSVRNCLREVLMEIDEEIEESVIQQILP
ncbi:NYN domain-containing protein [Geitlerinema sp. PCC 9228]|uniref:NYN domain-containing protein n=1 Tax=Geitlerinema sp. PCC 9228 TaxID=111611 RepID=UPI0008F9E135|nr:NYN domain-containing protein [Geitlerinema sp. PCC 9228]